MTGAARLAFVASLLIGVPAAVAGPGVPGPDYFRGLYERVGRDRMALPVDDRVRIEPEGDGLSLRACGAAPLSLRFAPWSLGENFLSGQIRSEAGAETLVCQFHNDGNNRPLLTCQSDQGTKLSLWPAGDGFRDGVLDC